MQLDKLARALDITRRSDPLSMLIELNGALHRTFAYDAKSTQVDSLARARHDLLETLRTRRRPRRTLKTFVLTLP